METTTSINSKVISKAGTALVEKVTGRTAYIDMVRLVMTILVVAVHAAVTYGSIGDWTYVDPNQDEVTGIVLSFVVFYSQSFFMALFFFFTGYFTPGSVDRKGWGSFWKERILRIGIPMVAYTWFLSRIPNYIDEIANLGYSGSFWKFSLNTFWTDADEGPTWFLFTILLFSAVYFIVRFVGSNNRIKADWIRKIPAPSNLMLASAAVFISIAMFLTAQYISIASAVDIFDVFSLKLAFFPSYIVFFIAGIIAFRSGWMDQLGTKIQRFWNWVTVGLLVSLPALLFLGGAPDGYMDLFLSGLNWRCLLTCIWFGFASISFSISLTMWLRNRVSGTSKLAAIAGKDNYAVYIIHPLILVPIAYALSFTNLTPMVKFFVNMGITVPLCFLAAEILRRIPGLKRIL